MGTADLLGAFPTFEDKARALISYPRVRLGNDNMGVCKLPWVDVFNPESAARTGTDSTEKGRTMWARVKGQTENALLAQFKNAYMFRPGYMQPTKGQKNALKAYSAFTWMYPALRALFPKFVCTLKEVGLAMINTVTKGYHKQVLELKDIVDLAAK